MLPFWKANSRISSFRQTLLRFLSDYVRYHFKSAFAVIFSTVTLKALVNNQLQTSRTGTSSLNVGCTVTDFQSNLPSKVITVVGWTQNLTSNFVDGYSHDLCSSLKFSFEAWLFCRPQLPRAQVFDGDQSHFL